MREEDREGPGVAIMGERLEETRPINSLSLGYPLPPSLQSVYYSPTRSQDLG